MDILSSETYINKLLDNFVENYKEYSYLKNKTINQKILCKNLPKKKVSWNDSLSIIHYY